MFVLLKLVPVTSIFLNSHNTLFNLPCIFFVILFAGCSLNFIQID